MGSESYKLAGAVLSALLVIFGFKTLLDIRMAGHGGGHGPGSGYTLPVGEPEVAAAPAAEAGKPADAKTAEAKPAGDAAPPAAPAAKPAEGGAAPPAAPAAAGGFDAKAAVALVAKANAEAGAGSFKKCAACHSASATDGSKAGPNLWNIVGRKVAGRDDFKGYSEAMKSKGGEWTYESLAAFVHNPKGYVPGTKMIFPGLKEAQDVADLLAHIRTLADSPAAMP